MVEETIYGLESQSSSKDWVVIPLFALSASIGPFVSQNWGGKAFLRANEAMRLTFQWSLLWGAVVAFCSTCWYPLIHQFDSTPSVADVAADYLVILPISYGAWGHHHDDLGDF